LPDSTLKFSNSWVYKFKKKNNLRNYQLYGKANSAPIEILPEQKIIFHEIIKEYLLENIFNADKTDISKSNEESNSEEKELESENSNNEESHASSSKNSIRRGYSHPRLSASNINKQNLADFEKDENDELIIDLTTNSLDPTIECEINNFNNLNNSQILTEDVLDEMQI
ncbi:30747_t:CDS:2, partial [Racocetra persica]